MIFTHLTSDQVNSVHNLFQFLRKLSVIGIVKTTTEHSRMTEMGRPIRYKLKFVNYDASMKGKLTPEEKLGYLLSIRTLIDNGTRQSE
jgi:hypothetical protein